MNSTTPTTQAKKAALSENDRAELDKFKLYLAACKRWDAAYDDVILNDLQAMVVAKKRIKAQAAIYEQIYGEKP